MKIAITITLGISFDIGAEKSITTIFDIPEINENNKDKIKKTIDDILEKFEYYDENKENGCEDKTVGKYIEKFGNYPKAVCEYIKNEYHWKKINDITTINFLMA